MRAAQYTRYGPPEVVTMVDLPTPVPGPGEVLVRVHVTSLSAGDWRLRAADPWLVRLFFGLRRPKCPVLGSDFAGVIEAVGEGVTTWQAGMRVCGTTDLRLGAHAEYLIQPADGTMAEISDDVAMERAAVLAFGGLTAQYFLHDLGHLSAQQHILVIGAGGSVGNAAVQLAKHAGAQVTAMASGPRQEVVMRSGADAFIDYTTTDFKNITDRYDMIFDAAGKVPYARCRHLLAPAGRYLTTGLAPRLPLQNLFARLRGDRRRGFFGNADFKGKAEQMRSLVEMLSAGELTPLIGETYQLTDIQAAHAHAQTGHKIGNIAVIVTPE